MKKEHPLLYRLGKIGMKFRACGDYSVDPEGEPGVEDLVYGSVMMFGSLVLVVGGPVVLYQALAR
jgi:hypothetical protein